MDKNDFINYYRRTYGEDPDPEVIDYYMGGDISSNPSQFRPSEQLSLSYTSGASDLLLEIREITSGIAENVRTTLSQRKDEVISEKPVISEFGFMFLIFLSKSILYFLFKSSYEQGYDFSNI